MPDHFQWDTFSMKPRQPSVAERQIGLRHGVSCAVNSNDLQVFVGDSLGFIASAKIPINPKTRGDPAIVRKAHTAPVYTLCFDGERLWSGSKDTICVWMLRDKVKEGKDETKSSSSKQPEQVLSRVDSLPLEDTGEVNALATHKDRTDIAGACGNGQLIVLDRSNCTESSRMGDPSNSSLLAVQHCDANTVATGAEDGSTKIWDIRSGSCVRTIEGLRPTKTTVSKWISSLAVDTSESFLSTADGNNHICTYYIASGLPIANTQHNDKIMTLACWDNKLVAGTSPMSDGMDVFSIDCKSIGTPLPCSLSSVYDLSIARSPRSIMIAAGAPKEPGQAVVEVFMSGKVSSFKML